jgi:hypothetical protein
MPLRWSELTITPDQDAIERLRQDWAWLLPQQWTPLLFSAFGDVFLERADGVVSWLNTGTGELVDVAADRQCFRTALAGDAIENWFLPPLIEKLHDLGKILEPGQCYSYTIFPVFAEGKYEPDNIWVSPMKEHFGLSGDLHRQLKSLPNGQKVQIVINDSPTSVPSQSALAGGEG